MQRTWTLALAPAVVFCLLASTAWPATAGTGPERAAAGETGESDEKRAGELLESLPMHFEPNVGQTHPSVRYVARGREYNVFLTEDGATLSLVAQLPAVGEAEAWDRPGDTARGEPAGLAAEVVRMTIEGAHQGARIVPERELAGTVNYLTGSDPEAWRTNVPTYQSVRYEAVYEGVDAVFYGKGQNLEYDFVVGPGADPSQIRVRFEGQREIAIDEGGEVVLELASGAVRQQRAVVYQEGSGGRRDVGARYVLRGDGEVGFELGAYDRSTPLVIDPVILYEGYIGGSRSSDTGYGLAVDASGAVYVAGQTSSTDFPVTAGAFDTTADEDSNAFVFKLSASGALEYATYLGGESADVAVGVGVDDSGGAYVAGYTWSPGFPTTPGAYDVSFNGSIDLFLAKVAPGGAALSYSSFIGGSSSETARGIKVTASSVYLVGYTSSTDFPTTPGAYDTTHNGAPYDGVVVRWDLATLTVGFSTYIGGSGFDIVNAVAIGPGSSVTVAGVTASADFPVTEGAADGTHNGGNDAFVVELSASGAQLLSSTFLGGTGDDGAEGLELAAGQAVVVGYTRSTDFPTTLGAFDRTLGGTFDAFVTKLQPAAAGLAFSTYLGGTFNDFAYGVATDVSSAVYVIGESESTNYPTTAGAFDRQNAGFRDGVVTKLAPDGASLAYSTYIGGSSYDHLNGVVVDAAGAAHVVGVTMSLDYPLVDEVPMASRDDSLVVVTKISPSGGSLERSTTVGGILGTSYEPVDGVAIDASGAVYLTGSFAVANFPVVPGSIVVGPNLAHDVFVTKIAPDGKSLVYSTYLGGNQTEMGYGIAVDAAGSVYVAGNTASANFPVTAGAFDTSINSTGGISDAFVTKLADGGTSILYSTFLGSSTADAAFDVAVDGEGNAYVAGHTSGPGFPTTAGAFDEAHNGSTDVFVSKLSPGGHWLVYSTYLGGSQSDAGPDIAIDPSGAAYVSCSTDSADFPVTPGAFDTLAEDANNGAVAKLSPSGGALGYATFLGGGGADSATDVAVDASGSAYVVGYTRSADFPTTPGAFDRFYGAQDDAFAAKLSASGAALVYATFLGGIGSEYARGVAVDAGGAAFVTGYTSSLDYPTTGNAPFRSKFGFTDAFVTKVSPSGSALEYSTYVGGTGTDYAYCVAVNASNEVVVGGSTSSSNFAATGFGVRDGRSGFVFKVAMALDRASVGIYAGAAGAWFLRNANGSGLADLVFFYGSGGGGLAPLVGDWDGDGRDTPALYDPGNGAFFLRNTSGAGSADLVFTFGVGGSAVMPIVGDWDGDGTDTVGLYDTSTGAFFLRNANAGGPADAIFFFGSGGTGAVPIAGDWDGDGTDTVGLYVSANATFFLRYANAGGPADLTFIYGGSGSKAIVGDWNGDGVDTVGIYNPALGAFFLNNVNWIGGANLTFFYGGTGAVPLAGNWDGR